LATAEFKSQTDHQKTMQTVRDEEIRQQAEIITGLERIKRLTGGEP